MSLLARAVPGVAGVVAAVRAGETTAVESVQACLARTLEVNSVINAMVHLDGDAALAAAREVDAALAAGIDLPLAGVVFAAKESEPVSGWRTTHGDPSAMSARHAADSPMVARFREAGAVCVGATNLALYGAAADSTNPRFGATRNPHDRRRVPGGSSGGSAAAVAAGMVPLATGTDGGGSLRIPAAACGIVALKSSRGLIPAPPRARPGWASLAVSGPLTATVLDLCLVLDVATGRDRATSGFAAAVDQADLRGLRVAWSPTLGYATVDARISSLCAAAALALAALGARVDQVAGPLDEDPVAAWTVLSLRGIVGDVRRAHGPASGPLPAAVAELVDRAAGMSAAEVHRARRVRAAVARRFATLHRDHDILLTPTTAQFPPLLEVGGNQWVQLTHPFNLTGAPALSIPVGFAEVEGERLPVGLQVCGVAGDDLRVVAVAATLARALGGS